MPVLKYLTTTLAKNGKWTYTFLLLIILCTKRICLETLCIAVLALHFLLMLLLKASKQQTANTVKLTHLYNCFVLCTL